MKHDVRWLAVSCVALSGALAASFFLVRTPLVGLELAAAAPADRVHESEPLGALPWFEDSSSEREELTEARAAPAPGRAAPPEMRARVVVEGHFLGVRGLGHELAIRVQARWARLDERYERLVARLEEELGGGAPDPAWHGGSSVWRGPESCVPPVIEDPRSRATARSDGRFELDVTHLLEGTLVLPDTLEFSVEHENFRAVTHTLPLEVRGQPLDADLLGRDARIVLEFERELEPMCVVRGTARCYDAAGSVHMEAWRIEGGVPAALLAEASVSSDGDVFELRVPLVPRLAIVAFSAGYLPETRIVYPGDELDLWLPRLVLNHGQRYSGRVELGRHSLGTSTWVYLSRESPVLNRERFSHRGFVWFDNRFEREASAVETDASGRFEITGLAGGAYELRMGVDPRWWTQMDPTTWVHAPAEGVLLVPALARIELRIEQESQPVDRRALEVRGLGRAASASVRLATDRWGRAELHLFPGEPYLVHVEQARGGPWIYGKVTSLQRLDSIERISMGAPARGW